MYDGQCSYISLYPLARFDLCQQYSIWRDTPTSTNKSSSMVPFLPDV